MPALEGKVAVITGGSSGIGLTTATSSSLADGNLSWTKLWLRSHRIRRLLSLILRLVPTIRCSGAVPGAFLYMKRASNSRSRTLGRIVPSS
jgi:hypothetical protein